MKQIFIVVLFVMFHIQYAAGQCHNIEGDYLRDKSYEYITKIFHCRTFQFYNIVIFVYFQNFLNQIQYSYTFPSFEKVILKLSDFLIIIFIIMVATEVLNYILSAIYILGKLTYSVRNFETMNIFFLNEEKLKQ